MVGGEGRPLPPLPALSLESYAPDVRGPISDAYQRALGNPRSAEANGRLGMLLYVVDQFEHAETCFERARLVEPDEVRWSYYLAWAQSKLSKHAAAVASLERVLRRSPGYLPARLKQAGCLLDAGRTTESRALYETLVAEHPDLAEAHYGLGRILVERRETAAAVKHLGKACELFPGFGAAHYAVAGAYRDRGETDKAREHLLSYQKTRTGWPTTPDPLLAALLEHETAAEARLEIGMRRAEAGDVQGAIDEHEAALKADPGLVQTRINLIGLYGLAGRPDRAEEQYRAALALNPNLAAVHFNYGVLLAGLSRSAEAEGAFRRALELDPAHVEARNRLAHLLMAAGRLDEAAEGFRTVLERHPDNRTARFYLSGILLQRRQYREAIDVLQGTLAPADRDAALFAHALATAYARAGETGKALEHLREARSMAEAAGRTDLLGPIEKDLRALQAAAGQR
jgi:tetratricopeptide (TPR) repeat protein